VTARALLRAVLLAALAACAMAAPAAAHPLGLPAFAQVVASGDVVTVTWNAAPDDVAALARSVGTTGAQALTREEDGVLATSTALRARVLRDVRVVQDGRRCDAAFRAPGSVVLEGLTAAFTCPAPVTSVRVRIALLHDVDSRYRTLASWTDREGSQRAMFSSASPEHELELVPGGSAAPTAARRSPAGEVQGAFGGALPLERRFVAAVDSTPGVLAGALALLVAFAVGAVHALAPGHGKAVAAGYLLGERARLRHATALGATVALMHTGSVLVLGTALYSATRAPDAARLSSALGLVTGVTFTGLGLWLLRRRLGSRGHAHAHTHDAHAHDAPGALSLQGVVALGAAGGLLPSPSALLVLLTALAAGRIAYGLSLIAAFSLGLAATVTLVGVAVLRGRDVVHDRAGERLHRLVHAAPTAGAAAVVLVGAGLTARAAAGLL
jgi:nickel/cobalt transporter (NicO) family protein